MSAARRALQRHAAVLGVTALLGVVATAPRAARAQAQTADVSAPGDRVQQARDRFDQGNALYERGNFDAALAEYDAAYHLLAGHPRQFSVLFNIAQCHERMFRYDAALQAYARYLREGGPAAEERGAVEATIRTLSGLLAVLDVRTNVPRATVWVDERAVGEAPGEVHVASGRHVVELRAAGFLPARREVSVPARGREALTLTLERVGVARGPAAGWFWAGVTLTVVALGGATVSGAVALVQHDHVQGLFADAVTRWAPSTLAEYDAMRGAALASDVLYASAAVLAVGTVVLGALMDLRGGRSAERAPGSARAALAPRVLIAPSVGPGAAGLRLVGAF